MTNQAPHHSRNVTTGSDSTTYRMCMICDEPITGEAVGYPGAHRECMLREVIGGIGHLIDHAHFCSALGDPDAGLSRRLSSLLVDTYVHYVGIDETVARSTL